VHRLYIVIFYIMLQIFSAVSQMAMYCCRQRWWHVFNVSSRPDGTNNLSRDVTELRTKPHIVPHHTHARALPSTVTWHVKHYVTHTGPDLRGPGGPDPRPPTNRMPPTKSVIFYLSFMLVVYKTDSLTHSRKLEMFWF